MKKRIFGWLLVAVAFMPALAAAQIILVNGKSQSKVTAQVTRADNLIITDDQGGWFGQGLTMQQLGGWETAYEVQARLRVISTAGKFRVRMDQPLEIRNQAKPTQAFQTPKVNMGVEGADLKPLTVGQGIEFENPAPPSPNIDSEGYYNLAVSAYPPAGDFKSTTGTYTGTLSLIFEPIVTK
ncbi:hypothetical protein [Burkholderia cepacia]|uniref:Fimbrial assembly protein n=1 Tax=Burkholderia cepacia TaxID=292 RepID=A0ABM6P7P0_BURCE|nr:hypothetical protein [Burkholderia cepacia]AIO29458.1 hypothetical protein DM41_4088 [Burkholderia cepacia ATCC 25416]ALK21267.1 hypothetical protein APZ15_26240 [Burkholderia cepacia ATCC 25416]ASE98660.1 hypothetical protein CEQ23_35670 [Burkholderia cepacia]ATF83079.1 hypothetical protein CO711_38625 [Burkholderia cepacia]MCA8468970.1 hypothetical protein [Burkholderia cepacia]